MEAIDLLRRSFRHDAWANREVAADLARDGEPPPDALRWLAHILAAERLWLDRLYGRPPSSPVWPDRAAASCRAEAANLADLWVEYLDSIDGGRLEQQIEYVNSLGEPWKTTVADVLVHVLEHSAYHRGQIASAMRRRDREPVYTDYVHAARRGWLDETGNDR